MRDLALTLFLLGSLPFILKRPVYGIFLWIWVGVMNPHKMTWSFAASMPFAQLIALATLAGMVFTSRRDKRHLPLTPLTIVLMLFVFWMNVSMLFAVDHAGSYVMWDKVMKIFLMTFVTMYVLHSRQHVQVLIWIVTLSIAFFGVKGGIFTLRGGGDHRVWGPPGGYIQDANGLGLALVMTIPLLRFLQVQVAKKWAKWAFTLSMVLCGFAILGTHSRGAFLAIATMLGFLWLKSRNKLVTGVLLLALVPVALTFMPETWTKRMHTIETYEQDGSAMGRLNAWAMAFNLAMDRPFTGGGFEVWSGRMFAMYAPDPLNVRSAHSIYFQILGEHGFVGLVLFLVFWVLVWHEAAWLIRNARNREGWQWASDMARMIQVSLVGYAVGGAFVNMAYFDVPYYLAVALVLTRVLLEKEVKEHPAPAMRWGAPAAAPRPPDGMQGAGGRPAVQGGQGPIPRVGRDPPAANKIKNI